MRLIGEWRSQGREAFMTDPLLQGAMLWRLQTMAESVVQLSDGIKSRHQDIDWLGIRGFRNIIVHEYTRIDSAIVVGVVRGRLDDFVRFRDTVLQWLSTRVLE